MSRFRAGKLPFSLSPSDMAAPMKSKLTLVSLAITCLLVFFVVDSVAKLQRFQQPSKADGSLSVLVVGDWGRRGTHNQSQVALQMGIIGEKLDPDFIISTGDNFYEDGLVDVNDPAFDDSFTNIYTAPSLQNQWFSEMISNVVHVHINKANNLMDAVLGNHDYRGDVLAQLSPALTQKDRKWLCLRSFIVDAGIVEFFFVDTTPFQDKYFTEEEDDHTYDWRGVLPREHYLSNLLNEVEVGLRESSAKWKIVVGHHTIKSAGHHGDTLELVAQLLPILEANKVDLYVNGHDHCLQHISSPDSDLQFLTSGGGSKAWRGDVKWLNPNQMKFYYDGQGFMTLQITQNEVYVMFYDIVGNVLHKWSTSKPLYSAV